VITAGAERFVDHDLDRRLVTDGEQLLRDGLGGWEESSSETSRGNDSTADLHGSDDILQRPMPTYVYKFVETGETIEVQQGFHEDNLTEIAHPDSGEVMPVKKVFTPVGVTFKGSGFFKTDNRGKKSATPSGGKEPGGKEPGGKESGGKDSGDSKSSKDSTSSASSSSDSGSSSSGASSATKSDSSSSSSGSGSSGSGSSGSGSGGSSSSGSSSKSSSSD